MSTSLTHDERKAAEAAFQGLPLNPKWTHRAQEVYRGMWAATHRTPSPAPASPSPVPDQTPSIPYRDATPMTVKPVQAWSIHFDDQNDAILMLFPVSASMTFILTMIQQLNPNRPFHMHPLKQGHFPITWPDEQTIASLYAHDARIIDQSGHIRLPQFPTPPTSE